MKEDRMKGNQNQLVVQPLGNWQYNITWEITCPCEWQNKEESICEYLQAIGEKEWVSMEVDCGANQITVVLRSQHQLHLNKWQRILETSLKDYLTMTASQIIWKQSVTKVNLPAMEDDRISKWIDTVREIDYYDLEEGLVDEDTEALKVYLKERALSVIEQEDKTFLVDREALSGRINLNCFECTKRHQYGCCCGSPCAMSEKNKAVLEKHLLSMEEALGELDEVQYQTVMDKGGFVAANGAIKEFDGHCAFLVEHEDVYKCMAHKYALDQGIPIYSICPLSCLMYPLEILELVTHKRKRLILLTAALEESFAERFSRWGSYVTLEVELKCIHEEAADEVFIKEAYQPVYEVNRGLLQYEFGEQLMNALDVLFKK